MRVKSIDQLPERHQAQAREQTGARGAGDGRLPVGEGALTIPFPWLILPSINVMQRAGKKARQATAREEALRAAEEVNGRLRRLLHRFERPVRIRVEQVLHHKRRARIDVDNLYTKHVIDALIEREGGLGVIVDDGPKYVVGVDKGYHPHVAWEGVLVTIEVADPIEPQRHEDTKNLSHG